jgi:hypothetical protein
MKLHEGTERSCSHFVLFFAVVVSTKKEVVGSHYAFHSRLLVIIY